MRQALVFTLALCVFAFAGCGGDSGGSGVTGTYSMDAADFFEKMMTTLKEQMGPMLDQMPEAEKEKMFAGFKEAKVEMEVKDDGTYTINAVMQGDTDVNAGTWTQEGDVVTFLQKTENGKPKEDAQPIKATFANGELKLKPDVQMPFDIIMKKK